MVRERDAGVVLDYLTTVGIIVDSVEVGDGFQVVDLGVEALDVIELFRVTGVKAAQVSDYRVIYSAPPTTQDYINVVAEILKRKPAEYGYDDIVSACSYATSSVLKFNAEGRAFAKWRDMLWTKCFELSAEAEATGIWPDPGTAAEALPKFEDVLASIDE